MYAVIKTGGKQYCVTPGEQLQVEKIPGEVGDAVTFDQVMLTSDGDAVQIGRPFVENAKVMARIARHGKGRKIVVFKYKRRKNYRRKRGHRQLFTLIKIENIES